MFITFFTQAHRGLFHDCVELGAGLSTHFETWIYELKGLSSPGSRALKVFLKVLIILYNVKSIGYI